MGWGGRGGVRARRLIAPLTWVYPLPASAAARPASLHSQEGRLHAVSGGNRCHAPSDVLS